MILELQQVNLAIRRGSAYLLEDILVQVAEISEDIAWLILGRNKQPDCERLQLLLKAIEQQKNLQAKVLENAQDDYSSYVAISQLNNRFLQAL